MFRNYSKSAWRNLLRNETSSIINIGGLSGGIAAASVSGFTIDGDSN